MSVLGTTFDCEFLKDSAIMDLTLMDLVISLKLKSGL